MEKDHQRSLILFFIISFLFSWLLWLPTLLKANAFPDLPDIVGLPGMFAPFGPAVAAFWLTWRQSGKQGVKRLWSRAWKLNFNKWWLIPALLLGPLTALLVSALMELIGAPIVWEYSQPISMLAVLILQVYFTQALPEEFGWRGFALDRLQLRFNAVVSSLILGAIWALWHLPLFFIEGTVQHALPIHEFILQTMVLSVFYTWLHNSTGGSVLIAILYHTTGNISSAAIPFWTTSAGRWLDFAVLVILAGVIIWRYGSDRLTRQTDNVSPMAS